MKNFAFAISVCAVTFLSVAFVITVGICYNPIATAKTHTHSLIDVNPVIQEIHKTIYDFELPASDGSTIKLADYKGKVLLIVNTAAKCLFASQYKHLEELHECYKDKGLVVIGVSSDDFGQEVEDHTERICSIADRVETTFIMTDTVQGREIPSYNNGFVQNQANNRHSTVVSLEKKKVIS